MTAATKGWRSRGFLGSFAPSWYQSVIILACRVWAWRTAVSTFEQSHVHGWHWIHYRCSIHLQVSQKCHHLMHSEQMDLHQKHLVLLHLIWVWCEVQMVYMPCVTTLLPSSPNDTFELHEPASPSASWEPPSVPAFLAATNSPSWTLVYQCFTRALGKEN